MLAKWIWQLGSLGLITSIMACSPSTPERVARPDLSRQKVNDVRNPDEVYASVDILFVVDNSYSMDAHQFNLARNIGLFTKNFSSFGNIDYHMGVVTTDMSPFANCSKCMGQLVSGNPGGVKFVTPQTAGGDQILAGNLLVGRDGSATEESFAPVVAALSTPNVDNWNKGFFRDQAHLAVVFITDAEDQSRISAKEFYNFLVALKKSADKVLAYGAIVPSSVNNCARDELVTPLKIEEFLGLVVNAGASNLMSLCAPDFADRLSRMSADIVRFVGRIIYLNRPPKIETIRVVYGTQVIPQGSKDGWTFDPERNAVVFGDGIMWSVQPRGTRIKVLYEALRYDN